MTKKKYYLEVTRLAASQLVACLEGQTGLVSIGGGSGSNADNFYDAPVINGEPATEKTTVQVAYDDGAHYTTLCVMMILIRLSLV